MASSAKMRSWTRRACRKLPCRTARGSHCRRRSGSTGLRVVVANGRGDIERAAFVVDQPVLVEQLPGRELHAAPPSVRLAELLVVRDELPVAEQVVEVAFVLCKEGLKLLGRFLRRRLC